MSAPLWRRFLITLTEDTLTPRSGRTKVSPYRSCGVCVCVFPQMSKGQLPQRPPTDFPDFHLRQRGPVCDPALGPLGRQSHAGSPAEGNHPGGRQQR